ncbi:MAG: alpha amylase [Lachnospiraceae bacterium]|nr:alpha amylase [Lachnospiraceae bacterium]
MKQRILSFALILVFCITTISSCGSKAAGNPDALFDWENNPVNIVEDNYRNYYEIFVRSFYDTNGDGIGDLNGVTAKLDYIKDMGFNGIWLMPIMPSPTYHKYDVTDYMSVDSVYGSVDQYKDLVTEAHKRGIRVIIDFVMNHTSTGHPWFKEACKALKGGKDKSLSELAKECKYINYYHFADSKVSSTYYQVSGTEVYYEGQFWDQMPDLNYACADLRREFEDIAKFWVDLGTDGFRMDATLHFEENDTAFNCEVMNWIYKYCKTLNPEFYMVSEVWDQSTASLAQYYGSETDSLFNFNVGGPEGMLLSVARGNLKAEAFVKTMVGYEETFGAAYDKYIDAPFITNHDMGRVTNTLNSNVDSMKYAGGLLLSMNGSPFVYYGEEIGLKSKGSKDENKRLPMEWGEENGRTNPPPGADKVEQNFPPVSEQLTDQESILKYYKRALLLRNQYPEIARGHAEIVDRVTSGHAAAVVKDYNGDAIGIVYNSSPTELVNLDTKQVYFIKNQLEHVTGQTANNIEIVGFLTVDNSEPSLSEETMTLPPRSITYVKLKQKK